MQFAKPVPWHRDHQDSARRVRTSHARAGPDDPFFFAQETVFSMAPISDASTRTRCLPALSKVMNLTSPSCLKKGHC